MMVLEIILLIAFIALSPYIALMLACFMGVLGRIIMTLIRKPK